MAAREIAYRAGVSSNEQRLRRMLDLMRLHAAGIASEIVYLGIIREHSADTAVVRRPLGPRAWTGRKAAALHSRCSSTPEKRAVVIRMVEDNTRRAKELADRIASQTFGGLRPA